MANEQLAIAAYEAYKNHLGARTENWHELRKNVDPKNAMSEEAFDRWVVKVKKNSLPEYFMGTYADMPHHTQAGWQALAAHAGDGAQVAWDAYVVAAKQNFSGDPELKLPHFAKLYDYQQDAIKSACRAVLKSR